MKRMFDFLSGHMSARSDLYLAAFLILIVAMIVIPLPVVVIDILLAINIATALIIFITTIYLKNVLELSTFPTLLLVSTMFRLALTVSTTRLILADGDAGQIITGFGDFVVAGNAAVGMIVFLIIATVQFIVVTKGAERIAEVSARFTLDAMPGKQMSIDADLRNGVINGDQAQEARRVVQTESQFFGAMDGALRFVKGDAIAALIVIFVNLIGGISIAVTQRGMALGEAGSLYALLTIGDGLVGQIPALLSAAAAGTVVTRVAGGKDSKLATEIGVQIFGSTRVLGITAIVLVCIGLLPGFPAGIFLGLASICGALAFGIGAGFLQVGGTEAIAPTDTDEAIRSIIRARFSDTIMVRLREETIVRLERQGLAAMLEEATLEGAREIGATNFLPGFRADESQPPDSGAVVLEGIEIGRIDFSEHRPPVAMARDVGWYSRRCMGYLYGMGELSHLFEDVGRVHGKLAAEVEETVPALIAVEMIRLLLLDFVPMGNMRSTFEMLLKDIYFDKDPFSLAGKARQLNLPQLLLRLTRPDGRIPVVAFAPAVKTEVDQIIEGVSVYDPATVTAAAGRIDRLTDLVALAARHNRELPPPALIVDERLRLAAARMAAALRLFIPVLADSDLGENNEIEVVATCDRRPAVEMAEAAE